MAVLLASASSLALFSMSLVALRRSGALAHRPNSSFNPNPLRCFVQTCCKLFQCRLTIVVAAGRVNSSVRLHMSASSLIQLIAACVGIIGSLFFAIGVMRQSTEAMARLSGTYWDWNPNLPPALAAQKADYLFGGGLIVSAFSIQLASFFFESAPFLSARATFLAPWCAAAGTLVVFLALRMAARRLAQSFDQQIVKWLKDRQAAE